MNKEKINDILANKMAIIVMDKSILDALKAARKEGNPIKMWIAEQTAKAWLEVREEKMMDLESAVAEFKLDLIAECEKMGINPNDFGLFDEVNVDFKEKEGK